METKTDTPIYFLDLDSALDWTGFKSADEKYRALVSAASREEEEKLTEELNDFFSSSTLSKRESEVFDIDARDVPGLHWAYWRYQSLIGQNETYFGEFCDQERLEHAKFYRGDMIWNFRDAVWFMTSVCDLPMSKSMGWVCKEIAAQIRCGLHG